MFVHPQPHIRLRVSRVQTFAMADVAKSHAALESGLTVGKLVLETGGCGGGSGGE